MLGVRRVGGRILCQGVRWLCLGGVGWEGSARVGFRGWGEGLPVLLLDWMGFLEVLTGVVLLILLIGLQSYGWVGQVMAGLGVLEWEMVRW